MSHHWVTWSSLLGQPGSRWGGQGGQWGWAQWKDRKWRSVGSRDLWHQKAGWSLQIVAHWCAVLQLGETIGSVIRRDDQVSIWRVAAPAICNNLRTWRILQIPIGFSFNASSFIRFWMPQTHFAKSKSCKTQSLWCLNVYHCWIYWDTFTTTPDTSLWMVVFSREMSSTPHQKRNRNWEFWQKPFSNICCQYSDAISTVKIESVLRHLAKSSWNMNMCSGKIVANKNCNFTKILCF